jgi:ribbon-helix-helix CopG family protein
MRKERTNIYITERQKKQLEQRSQAENLPIAELIRRALDAYLAWDDPTYHPDAPAPKKGSRTSSPA